MKDNGVQMLDTSDANGNEQLEETTDMPPAVSDDEDMPNMVSGSSSESSSSDSFPSSHSSYMVEMIIGIRLNSIQIALLP